MFLVSSCNCLCPIHWSQVLSWEWRCSWNSAERRCSNYIWVINNFIPYQGASYIRDLTVVDLLYAQRRAYRCTTDYTLIFPLWHYSDAIMSTRASQNTGVSILLNRLFRRRSKKTSKLCVIGHCERNSLVTAEFPAQKANNAKKVSIWWCHHAKRRCDVSVNFNSRHNTLIRRHLDNYVYSNGSQQIACNI